MTDRESADGVATTNLSTGYLPGRGSFTILGFAVLVLGQARCCEHTGYDEEYWAPARLDSIVLVAKFSMVVCECRTDDVSESRSGCLDSCFHELGQQYRGY